MNPLARVAITKVFPVVVLGFGIYLFGSGTKDAFRAVAAGHWPTVSGTVIRSEVIYSDDPKPGRPGSYTPRVEYAYVVDSRRHTSTAIAAVQVGSSRRGPAEDFVSSYPVGAEVTVRYHPRKHHIALVETGFSADLLIAPGLGFFMMVFGGVFLVAFMRGQNA